MLPWGITLGNLIDGVVHGVFVVEWWVLIRGGALQPRSPVDH